MSRVSFIGTVNTFVNILQSRKTGVGDKDFDVSTEHTGKRIRPKAINGNGLSVGLGGSVSLLVKAGLSFQWLGLWEDMKPVLIFFRKGSR